MLERKIVVYLALKLLPGIVRIGVVLFKSEKLSESLFRMYKGKFVVLWGS